MSSSQAQRQERLQARLRGAGAVAFSEAFTFGFNLPQEPQSPQDNLSVPPPPPPPQRTPPTRVSPRLNSAAIETPIQRSTRSSTQLSSTASLQQQSVRTSGQKRKRTDLTNDETPIPLKEAPEVPTGSQLHNLSSIPATSVSRHAETVTPQTRGRSSSDQFLTSGDGVATRLFGMDSGAQSAIFESPIQENIFKAFIDEVGVDADEMLLDPTSLLEDILGPDTEDVGEGGNDTVIENAWEQVQDEGEVGDGDGRYEAEDDEQEVDVNVDMDGAEEEELRDETFSSPRTSRKPQRSSVEISQVPKETEEHESEEEGDEEEGNKKEVEEEPLEEDEDSINTDDIAPEPTPKPIPSRSTQNNIQKPPPPPRSQHQNPSQPKKFRPKPKLKSKHDPNKKIEITVHRLSKSKTKQTAIPAINPLDVLSQVFKEMLKKQYGKLNSSVGKLALEVFADEIEVRLLEHIDTLNTTLQTGKEARKYHKMRQDKREELMSLRQELGKVELEIDEVRRKHERESSESKTKHLITQRLENISAAQELCRAHSGANPTNPYPTHPQNLVGGIDLLLAKLTSQVTSTRRRKRIKRGEQDFDHLDDEGLDEDEENLDEIFDEIFDEEMGAGGDGLETGSILERVRGFNRFLEKAEKVIGEANARRFDGKR